MELDVFKIRLRECFGDDSQETVGKKLNMTQGNVSKLLSGTQQPALDTLYRIAEVYSVSVDWLLGISNNKKTTAALEKTSYAAAVDILTQLSWNGADIEYENCGVSVKVNDPLLKALLKKGLTLYKTDKELYQSWKETKLSLFNDKDLVFQKMWLEDNIDFLASEAVTEANWLEVHKCAKDAENEYAEIMLGDPGPFGG